MKQKKQTLLPHYLHVPTQQRFLRK